MDDSDNRWHASLSYTIHDDGIWIEYGTKKVNLGFWPTVADVVDAAESFSLEESSRSDG